MGLGSVSAHMYAPFQDKGGKKALKCQLVSYFTLFSWLRSGTSLMHIGINHMGAVELLQHWSRLAQAHRLPAPLYLHCHMGWDWDSAWTWEQPSPHSCHPGFPYHFPAQKAVIFFFFSPTCTHFQPAACFKLIQPVLWQGRRAQALTVPTVWDFIGQTPQFTFFKFHKSHFLKFL